MSDLLADSESYRWWCVRERRSGPLTLQMIACPSSFQESTKEKSTQERSGCAYCLCRFGRCPYSAQVIQVARGRLHFGDSRGVYWYSLSIDVSQRAHPLRFARFRGTGAPLR